MIVETQTDVKTDVKEPFQSKLVWTESNEGKWYLEKRECIPAEVETNQDLDFIEFDRQEWDQEKDEMQKINQYEKVSYTSQKKILKVDKIEEEIYYLIDEKFVPAEGESQPEPIQATRGEIKKFVNFNFLILGMTKTFLLENIEVNLNSEVALAINIISEYLVLPSDIINLAYKGNKLEVYTHIHSIEGISEGETFLVQFTENAEKLFSRSTSKDYTLSDQKNIIPFYVDKNIIVTAFGFWKNYNSSPVATYDFMLYELTDEGRQLVTQMNSVKVESSETDSYGVKKVALEKSVRLKENVKYVAYVYYKLPDMATYYSYSCAAEQTVNGVKFKFYDMSEPGHRCSSTSGHMPYVYFKFDNPYES